MTRTSVLRNVGHQLTMIGLIANCDSLCLRTKVITQTEVKECQSIFRNRIYGYSISLTYNEINVLLAM